ncbi:cytochrome b/b6 domain-containing protein [Cohaesibacter celericrescens]|uniref:Cytochrome B n=1 Tax=Cohaesibacter celericrescens TaxID=2067669 RepID=A0A2N5XP50_9HYPH|nr:cytochrome b/b6 domain-containing protein [Cohaesibacter celericrescens]PLW76274.1 cytochrome B [Cohaesibacter celericrescens]
MNDQAKNTDTEPLENVKLWDPALRLFHWALVICVVAAWGLGRFGPDIMTLHFYFGYAICALLAFRLIWGFFGPTVARFGHFIYGPKTTLSYASKIFKREPSYWRGHNPLGALAAFALLGLLIAQVATGLTSDPDDFVNVGPLASYVGYDNAVFANRIHYQISNLILAMVGIHLAAIAFYKLWKRENLVKPMITGWKLVKKSDKA